MQAVASGAKPRMTEGEEAWEPEYTTDGDVSGWELYQQHLVRIVDPAELGRRWTPEQLTACLRGAEEAGRVEHVGYQWIDPGYGPDGGLMEKWEGQPTTSRMKPVWRVVPDGEEGT